MSMFRYARVYVTEGRGGGAREGVVGNGFLITRLGRSGEGESVVKVASIVDEQAGIYRDDELERAWPVEQVRVENFEGTKDTMKRVSCELMRTEITANGAWEFSVGEQILSARRPS